MQHETLTGETIAEFGLYLYRQEKSEATIEKYTRYARSFAAFLGGDPPARDGVIAFKAHIGASYTAAGANGMLAAVNSLLSFLGMAELRVRLFRTQRRLFAAREKELSRPELERLIIHAQSRGKERLVLLLRTLFATGIRVSELRFITVEALACGRADIRLKGKTRTIFLPAKLCRLLERYARRRGIAAGAVFVSRHGNPLDRSNIWREMKALCARANVPATKVFPHSLRHLFARTYYGKMRDLVELAGLMGHSDVNTTRIYAASSGAECRKRLESLCLIE